MGGDATYLIIKEDKTRWTLRCMHDYDYDVAALHLKKIPGSAEQVKHHLNKAYIEVTNKSDKQLQLPKIAQFDAQVRKVMKGLGDEPAEAAPARSVEELQELIKEAVEAENYEAAAHVSAQELAEILRGLRNYSGPIPLRDV